MPTPKSSAPKPAAAPPAPPAEKHPAPGTVSLNDVFTRWKAGARISDLCKEFKLSRPQVRRHIMLGAGSSAAFNQLRKAGAGGPRKTTAKGAPKSSSTPPAKDRVP